MLFDSDAAFHEDAVFEDLRLVGSEHAFGAVEDPGDGGRGDGFGVVAVEADGVALDDEVLGADPGEDAVAAAADVVLLSSFRASDQDGRAADRDDPSPFSASSEQVPSAASPM